MGKLSDTGNSDVLPEFQAFLLERKLVPEKNVFFYARWLGKYLSFARKKQLPADEYQENAVVEFIENLKSDPKAMDWQLRQAQDAIRLYYFHFLGVKRNYLSDGKATVLAAGCSKRQNG